MLRLLFFVMTYLADCQANGELVRSAAALGFANAVLMGLLAGLVGIRVWHAKPSRTGQQTKN